MTETELGAAGRTEAKAGGARDGLTGRQTDRVSRRAHAARAQAGSHRGWRGGAGGGCLADAGVRGPRDRKAGSWQSEPEGSVSLQSWDRVP